MKFETLKTKKALLGALEEQVRSLLDEELQVLAACSPDEGERRRFIQQVRPFLYAHKEAYRALREAAVHYRRSIASAQSAALLSRDSKGRFVKINNV